VPHEWLKPKLIDCHSKCVACNDNPLCNHKNFGKMKTIPSHPDKSHTRIHQKLLTFTAMVAIVLSACSDSPTGSNDGPGENVVEMGPHSFNPSTIIVAEGATVTWINTSSEVHTVTSGSQGNHDGRFDSGNMAPGEEFTYTFESTGTYSYFCIPHLGAGMTGTVSVVANGEGNGGGDDENNDDGYDY
jgi:plastocyanin